MANELRAVIPADCFEPDTATSLGYLSVSTIATALCGAAGISMLSFVNPANPLTWPIWAAYSAVTGTVALGLWVLAHECGHGAFSKNKALQDGIGYVIHSAMLVPYFSWQRSHAVHHQYTNNLELGETHVPETMQSTEEEGPPRHSTTNSHAVWKRSRDSNLGWSSGFCTFGSWLARLFVGGCHRRPRPRHDKSFLPQPLDRT
jgi:fatty acid desaturase